MSYYDPSKDLLYCEAELGPDVLDLIDLFRHGAHVIKNHDRNPYHIRGQEVRLNKAKSAYSFFENEWAPKRTVKGLLNPGEEGLDISEVHLAALMYGMRQDYFVEENNGRFVGWYLDPVTVYCGVLPSAFDDFEEAYSRAGGRAGGGSLALQSRNNDFLGKLAYSFARYMQASVDTHIPPFKRIQVSPPPP